MPAPALDLDTFVDAHQVEEISAKVYAKYSLVQQRLDNIVAEGQKLTSSWQSDGATQYQTDILTLKAEFDAFAKKYASFIESLTNFVTAYNQEKDEFVAKINARVTQKPGPGGDGRFTPVMLDK